MFENKFMRYDIDLSWRYPTVINNSCKINQFALYTRCKNINKTNITALGTKTPFLRR